MSRSRDTLDKGREWAAIGVNSFGLDVDKYVMRVEYDTNLK